MRHAFPFFILALLTACSPSEKRNTAAKARDTRDSLQTVIESRYPGINEFNAIDDPYLFMVQRQLQNNRHFLFKGFGLDDIGQGDSLWIVSFKGNFDGKHVLHFTCDRATAMGLIEEHDITGEPMGRLMNMLIGSSAVVAEIDTVQRIRFTVTSTVESEGEEVHSYLSIDANSPLLFTGRLIEVH
jgi:hypothetical protein